MAQRVYETRINWKNSPNISTPLAAYNLNKMDFALYEHDAYIVELDNLVRAEQGAALQAITSVEYDTTTGVFVFTKANGTTYSVDLNIEKIPVSFTMSSDGVLTMINTDGTTYTADVGSMIPNITFENSANIQHHVTVDASGDITVRSTIIDGSITDVKLQPQYLSDITQQASISSTSSTLAQSYAVGGTGTRPNEDYDNAKYYKEQARAIVGAHGHTIVDSAGNIYPNRMSLLFENGSIEDDATNDATHILMAATITDAEWAEIQAILV